VRCGKSSCRDHSYYHRYNKVLVTYRILHGQILYDLRRLAIVTITIHIVLLWRTTYSKNIRSYEV